MGREENRRGDGVPPPNEILNTPLHGAAVWQLQSKFEQTVQQHCLVYEFIWLRRTCDYIVECSLLRAVS